MNKLSRVGGALLLCVVVTGPVGARSHADRGSARVLQEAQELGGLGGVVGHMRRVRSQAGFFGAVALPLRFAGQMIVGEGEMPAARSSTEIAPHSLAYTFEDGAPMSYFSDFGTMGASMSAWEGSPDGSGSANLYASVYDGPFSSKSLGFFETSEEEVGAVTVGTSLWRGSWDEGGDEPASEAVLSEHRSVYGPEDWTYEGVDYHYKDFNRTVYSGGGAVSEGGTISSFEGSSRVEGVGGALQECLSTGDSMSDMEEGLSVVSDYVDSCDQLEAPFHFYYSATHSEYRWDPATNQAQYVQTGTLDCSDDNGAPMRYALTYDESNWSYKYTDLDTGEPAPAPACAWDPWESGFQG